VLLVDAVRLRAATHASARPSNERIGDEMNYKTSIDEHLAKVPLFAGLSGHERREVAGLLTDVNVAMGQQLVKEGAGGHEFFIILSGTAEVTRDGVHVADVGPGDFQGEISLLDGGPRTATVIATSPMTIMVANEREFSALLDRVPTVARKMLPALAHRIRTAGHSG
jgi:CRP/FNR family transcriptional regulator, cyclic AMP receptor protein